MAPTRPTPTPTPCTPRTLVRALLLVATLAAMPSQAATLGTLTAQSVRNEPLRAVVALPRATAGDTTMPTVRLASPAAYERLGFVRDPALAAATVRVVTEPDGQRFVRIDSDTPVGSAELVLLLEADAGMRRLYRLNLGSAEPADRVNVRGSEPLARGAVAPRTVEGVNLPTSAGANVREAAPVARREVATRDGASAPAGAPGATASATAPDPQAAARTGAAAPTARENGAAPGTGPADPLATPIAPQARPDAITVADGADLDSLARALRPPGATIEQSAAALWRANRASFIGRPPRPITGALLQVPSEATVLAIDQAEARAVVAAFAPEAVASAASSRQAQPPQPTGEARPRATAVAPAPAPTPAAAPAPARTAAAPPATRPAPRDRLVLAAPRAAPARTGRTPADVAFDAELEATLQRLTALEKRLASVRSGIERSADRELALMQELVDTTRRAAASGAAGSARGTR
ncbi:MAG: hypothetical protein EHM87_18750 [Burkholderiales bacterium]|nr:MAG: hypothetical protein EHM87_18750 [Burkholderiales bacterium]